MWRDYWDFKVGVFGFVWLYGLLDVAQVSAYCNGRAGMRKLFGLLLEIPGPYQACILSRFGSYNGGFPLRLQFRAH
jgi:hypothetical protein